MLIQELNEILQDRNARLLNTFSQFSKISAKNNVPLLRCKSLYSPKFFITKSL